MSLDNLRDRAEALIYEKQLCRGDIKEMAGRIKEINEELEDIKEMIQAKKGNRWEQWKMQV